MKIQNLVIAVVLLASCSNLTPSQKSADIAAVESFALNTALNVGTSYLTSGSITPAVISNSIYGAAQLVTTIKANTSSATQPVIQATMASGSVSTVVNTKIIPPVAAKAAAAIKAGNNPNAVLTAVTVGLQNAAVQLSAKSP